jgi:hypothetical protein
MIAANESVTNHSFRRGKVSLCSERDRRLRPNQPTAALQHAEAKEAIEILTPSGGSTISRHTSRGCAETGRGKGGKE